MRATFMRRALHTWAGNLPTRIIEAEQSSTDPRRSPLFERSVVWSGRLPLLGEVTLYLHHYLRSDPDAGLHDHPWPWAVALPLCGGYREERALGPMWQRVYRRLPGLAYFLRGYDFHRVVVAPGATSWSLFATGANGFKAWGFLRPARAAAGPNVCRFDYVEVPSQSAAEWWHDAPKGRDLDRAAP